MSLLPPDLLEKEKPTDVAKWLALYRDDFTCRLCGAKENLHVHHIIPVSKGGGDNLGNLVTVCRECHSKVEGTKRFQKSEYLEQMKKLKKKGKKQPPSTAKYLCRCKYCDRLFDSMNKYFGHMIQEEAKKKTKEVRHKK